MDGRLVFEHGDVMQLVQLMQANSPWDKGGDVGLPSLGRKLANSAAFAFEQVNNRISSKNNVGHHYDIGNALYELMLDPEYMQYSCGYWPEGVTTLSEAQQAKLAHIAAKLALEPGQRVLDIGCGWGGMAIYLAQNADVRVLGITLSEEQFALAEKRADQAGVADRVTLRAGRLPRPRREGRQVRPDRVGRHVRTCRPTRSSRPIFAAAPT